MWELKLHIYTSAGILKKKEVFHAEKKSSEYQHVRHPRVSSLQKRCRGSTTAAVTAAPNIIYSIDICITISQQLWRANETRHLHQQNMPRARVKVPIGVRSRRTSRINEKQRAPPKQAFRRLFHQAFDSCADTPCSNQKKCGTRSFTARQFMPQILLRSKTIYLEQEPFTILLLCTNHS